MKKAGGLTNSTTTQTKNQSYELVHPIIHRIYGACEGVGPADPKLQDLHGTGQQSPILMI